MVATDSRSAQQLACPLGCREGGVRGCTVDEISPGTCTNKVRRLLDDLTDLDKLLLREAAKQK